MWILEIMGCGPHPVRYHLVGGTSYTLGRKDCTILLPPNDPSISRQQCTLIVQPTDIRHITTSQQLSSTSLDSIQRRRREGINRFAGNTGSPSGFNSTLDVDESQQQDGSRLRGQSNKHYALTPEVILLDSSKHGCFVNDIRVDVISKRASLGEHDTIRLGAHVEISLFYRPIVASLSPTLSGLQCNNVTRVLCKLGCAINNPRKPMVSADAAITASPRHTQSLHTQALVVGGAGRDATARSRNNYSGMIPNHQGGDDVLSSSFTLSSPKRLLLNDSIRSNGGRGGAAARPSSSSPQRQQQQQQYNIRYVPVGKNEYERGMVNASNNNDVGAFSPLRNNMSRTFGEYVEEDENDGRKNYGQEDIAGRAFFNYSATDDIKLYLDPQTAQDKHFSPVSYIYVTERMQLNEPTCMMSMLLGYRPVDIAYLYTLYEVLLQSPATPMSRWPEPRTLEEMMLVDRPYFKIPIFLQDFRHTIPKTFTSMFRLLNFGTLEKRLYGQYSEVIVRGGGRCFTMDPSKVNAHFGDMSRFQRDNPMQSHDASLLMGSMNGSWGAASSIGGLSRAQSMAFSAYSSGSALTRGTSGYRRSRRQRAKKIPTCLKLMGIVDSPLDAHGVNLRVLISEAMFLYLTHAFKKATEQRKRELELRVRRRLHHEANPLGGGGVDGSFIDDEELPPQAFGVDPVMADAAINLFDNGYLLVHEDNIHSAIYTNDPATQFAENSPGVLAKSQMVDKADETDSDDTVDEDEERLQEYHRYNMEAIEGGDGNLITNGSGGYGSSPPSSPLLETTRSILLSQSGIGSGFQSPTSGHNDAALPDDDPVSLLMLSRRKQASPSVRVCAAQQVNTVTATGDKTTLNTIAGSSSVRRGEEREGRGSVRSPATASRLSYGGGGSVSATATTSPKAIRMASSTPPRQHYRR